MNVVKGTLALALVATSSLARADTAADKPMDSMWPKLPASHALTEDEVMVEHLSALGNFIGQNLDTLSNDLIGLHVDGRKQRARLRLGGGNVRYLQLRFDSDWHFADNVARVNARLFLGIAGHEIALKLPAMDVSTDSYHGASLVQVNMPLLEKHF
jgi:hypothetical protein